MKNDRVTVHPMEVRGKTYEVQVGPDGHWVAYYNSAMISADTRTGLYEKLLTLTRKAAATVRVPFAEVSLRDCSRGIATGLHSGNGNVLVEWLSGERRRLAGGSCSTKEQYSQRSNTAIVRGETSDQEIAEYQQLLKEQAAANKAVYAWTAPRRLELDAAVRNAVEEAVSDAPAE